MHLGSAVVVDDPEQLLNSAVAGAVVEVVDGLIIYGLVLRKDAGGEHGGHVAQVPVGPVVVVSRVVVLDQEAVVHGVEDVGEHGRRRGEVVVGEAVELAQDLSGVGELIAIKTRRQILVGVS